MSRRNSKLGQVKNWTEHVNVARSFNRTKDLDKHRDKNQVFIYTVSALLDGIEMVVENDAERKGACKLRRHARPSYAS